MNPLALKGVLSIAVFAAVFALGSRIVSKYNAGQQAIAEVAAAEKRADDAEKAIENLAAAAVQRETDHTNIRAARSATNKRIDHAKQADPAVADWAATRLPDGLRDAHLAV